MAEELTFLHLSDTHLLADEGELLGCSPAANLRRVLAGVAELPAAPRCCLISGDLAHDSGAAGYARLRTLLAPLDARGIPILPALGNHDDRAAFRRGFLGQGTDDAAPYHYARDLGGLRLIVLDSLVPGAVAGRLGAAQLAWLADELGRGDARRTVVALHHPAAPTGIPWLDTDLLADADALRATLAGHPILGVLAGHCHAASATTFAGTIAATAPAVAFQFRPGISDNDGGERIVAGSGFNLCTVRDGALIVNPIMR